ncbi:MAG TPA: phage major capsid protein [Pirellulales bacterium]|jgi:HK97 family phage major capsid protein
MSQLMTAKRLREERAPLAKKIREHADLLSAEKRDFTPEEKTNWESLNADYDSRTRQIEILERAEETERDQLQRGEGQTPDGAPKVRLTLKERRERDEERRLRDEGMYERAMQAWMRRQLGEPLGKQHTRACERMKVNPARRTFEIRLRRDVPQMKREFRALDAGITGSGGALVPQGFVNNLEKALLSYSGLRQAAETIRTDTGEELPWPTVNDTSNKGARIGANVTVSEQDVTFGRIYWRAYKYTSKMVQVPVELLQDSAFDLSVWLSDLLGERIGRIQNDEFTTGTGASMPNGLINAAAVGATTAANNAVSTDDFIKLEHSVDPAYRQKGMCSYMLHDSIKLQTRLLKDSYGRYLWGGGGLNTGAMDTLNDWPFFINQSMASAFAGSAYIVSFGQHQKYKIRDVGTIRMRRLVERYADNDEEGFVAFMRSDGNLLDAGTHPVKLLQMHS